MWVNSISPTCRMTSPWLYLCLQHSRPQLGEKTSKVVSFSHTRRVDVDIGSSQQDGGVGEEEGVKLWCLEVCFFFFLWQTPCVKVRPCLCQLSPVVHSTFDPGDHLRSPCWPLRARKSVMLFLVQGFHGLKLCGRRSCSFRLIVPPIYQEHVKRQLLSGRSSSTVDDAKCLVFSFL